MVRRNVFWMCVWDVWEGPLAVLLPGSDLLTDNRFSPWGFGESGSECAGCWKHTWMGVECHHFSDSWTQLSIIRICRDIFIWGPLQMWSQHQSAARTFLTIWKLQDLHSCWEKGEDLGVSWDKGQHSFCPQSLAVLAMVLTQELQPINRWSLGCQTTLFPLFQLTASFLKHFAWNPGPSEAKWQISHWLWWDRCYFSGTVTHQPSSLAKLWTYTCRSHIKTAPRSQEIHIFGIKNSLQADTV